MIPRLGSGPGTGSRPAQVFDESSGSPAFRIVPRIPVVGRHLLDAPMWGGGSSTRALAGRWGHLHGRPAFFLFDSRHGGVHLLTLYETAIRLAGGPGRGRPCTYLGGTPGGAKRAGRG